MTFKYKNVYVKDTATISGPYEKDGPLGEYFDKSYKDLYFGTDSWELAEQKIAEESIELLLKKTKLKAKDIELVIAGDLSNQITSTTFASNNIGNAFLGVYDACATSAEELIVASSLIDTKRINNAVCVTSSHNMVSEKQFRNPTEYGAPKPKTATFTATGGASCLLTNKSGKVKITAGTIGKVVDYNQTNPLDMGSVMAPAAADVLNTHLNDLDRDITDYDLILTGDLGIIGKNILIDFMKSEYGIDIENIYNDCGVMLYDLEKQKDVLAGGSGPVCSALVVYSDIIKKLEKKELKRVLYIATGALFNPTSVFQKENILGIAHAISLESI